MDWLDRTPVPAAQGLPDNPARGRRPVPNSAATSNGPPPPPPPIPSLRNASSNATLLASNATISLQVISLAREAMRNALESEKSQAAEAGAMGSLRSGVTIDLSRKNIQKLPEEVVDIVKDQLERLALSHNQLSSLPARVSECTSLRYLNIRGNQIKEFPLPLCDLKSLEILDLGRNQLRVLPEEIAKLSSLKVLSVPKNYIRELPLSLADMVSLQVLKFDGNPIRFPPKDTIQPQAGSPPNNGISRDTEVTEVSVTAYIKKFLRQYAINGRMELEATGDESSEGTETPRFALKRAASGRFPIKVSGADVPDVRSPNSTQRPPPVPTRSHYRGLSQQNTAIRRPGVMPLTIGNVNERLRSNSKTLLRSDRPDGRSRRMGIVTTKTSDLSTLDETQANIRFSHYRGLSHGSAMQGTPPPGVKSPATSTELYLQRPLYVRRLSILPERRYESNIFDPIMEAAKGILYSVFQIHPMIQILITLTNDGSTKRSSLEIVLYNTNSHVEELEQEIQNHNSAVSDGDNRSSRNETVYRACQTLVSAYGHVCSLLADNLDSFVNTGDPRYIRTLLILLYNTIMELCVTCSSLTTEYNQHRPGNIAFADCNETIRPYVREASVAPAVEMPPVSRSQSRTVIHNPSNLRVATDVAIPISYGSNWTTTITSASPRHLGEALPSLGVRDMGPDSLERDVQFDRIFLSLQRSADIMLQTLPSFNVQLRHGFRNAMQQRAPVQLIEGWKILIAMCNSTIKQTEMVANRLALVKLRDPGAKTQASFWNLCINFMESWTELVSEIMASINKIPLPPDTRVRLKPIQQSMKETSNAIVQSPWHQLLRRSNVSREALSPTPTPITPQSAALGPASQATVSTTPQSASFAAAFQGNVFDRADALLANPGISMARNGTMMRGHAILNSSISSMSSDGTTDSTRR